MKQPPITLKDLKGMACAPLNQHLFEEIKKVKVKKNKQRKGLDRIQIAGFR